MNTTTKVAVTGVVGVAAVAASLWLFSADKPVAESALLDTADSMPWESIPPVLIPSLDIVSVALASMTIDATSITWIDLELEGLLSLLSDDAMTDILAATPIDRARILAGILGSQAIFTTDLPVGEYSSMENWRSELAGLSPKERKDVVVNLLRLEHPIARSSRIASLLWALEMQKESPDKETLAKCRKIFRVKQKESVSVRQPEFVTGTVIWDANPDYDVSRLSFPVITVDPEYGPYAHFDFAAWAQRIHREQPVQVVIGWGNGLNNVEKLDMSQYTEYARQIRAVVRMVREVSPKTFIWVTTCYGLQTYKHWMQKIGKLGDGVALWNVAHFPVVPYFKVIHDTVSADAGNKPVMLLGFFGYKCFIPTAKKPAHYEQSMQQAEQEARDVGFAGFIRVEAQ